MRAGLGVAALGLAVDATLALERVGVPLGDARPGARPPATAGYRAAPHARRPPPNRSRRSAIGLLTGRH